MSTAEYRKEKYDNVSFKIPKGKREEYKQAADDFGIAQSEMFRQAVEAYIADRSLQSRPTSVTTPAPMAKLEPELTTDQRRLLDEFSQLPIDAQKALMKFLKSISGNQSANQPE